MIGTQSALFSQETDSLRIERPGLFVGFSLDPSQTHIVNNGILSLTGLLSEKQNSFGGSLEVGYFFSKSIGLSSGINFSSNKTQLKLASYQNKFTTTDSENETYERRVSGSNIREVQTVGFISVPVCLNIRLPFNETFGFFFTTGIDLAIPISKNYSSTGTFTYKGYYPAYNVLLENLPAYGFPSNISVVSTGEPEIKPINFNVLASAGFDFFVQKKIQIAIGVTFRQSLSNISDYTSPEKFQLSSEVNQINSMMGGSSEVKVESLGMKIILRYFLKSRL